MLIFCQMPRYIDTHLVVLDKLEQTIHKNSKFEQVYRDFEMQKVTCVHPEAWTTCNSRCATFPSQPSSSSPSTASSTISSS